VGFDYNIDPVDEMEDVVGVFYGGRGQVGQQYVVTNRRLLIGPLDTGVALEIDAYLANKASGGAGDLLKSVLGRYAPMNPKMLWLRHVAAVEPTNNAGWFKPPRLRITTDTGEVLEVGVVQTPTTMNRSKDNEVVRDRFVDVLRAASAAAKATVPGP
jgi:hypothetical protein